MIDSVILCSSSDSMAISQKWLGSVTGASVQESRGVTGGRDVNASWLCDSYSEVEAASEV